MIIYFYTETGEINEMVTATHPDSIAGNLIGRERYILTEDNYSLDDNYVMDGEIKPRPSMAVSVEGSVLMGVPLGAEIRLGEQVFTAGDSVVEIEGYTGTVKISCWPYFDEEVEI